MSDAYYVGAIAMQTQQRALDTIANNIANLNTNGFKRAELRFVDVVAGRAEATADQTLAGVLLDRTMMVDAPGEIQRTGNAMDVAIDGAGFIEVMGPGGQTLLWRGGTLKIGEDGMLGAGRGLALKAAITVPRDATALTLAADGRVLATLPGEAEPSEIGQIALVRVEDAAQLERLDGGLYRLASDARPIDGAPGEDGLGNLVQGALERSNVAMTDEMVRLMLVQRAYAANAQILQAADQMMAIANGLRR
ncbi:MAG: flagellar hook-basal body protein [Sphingomonas sp.]|nr:flagellar hook-basal body protein [Sphingomonas sp.]